MALHFLSIAFSAINDAITFESSYGLSDLFFDFSFHKKCPQIVSNLLGALHDLRLFYKIKFYYSITIFLTSLLVPFSTVTK